MCARGDIYPITKLPIYPILPNGDHPIARDHPIALAECFAKI
jgi:hypothetical protein